ncbi:hypothetical protein V8B97DRAFT_1227036 [Scleroderma yunnanense]
MCRRNLQCDVLYRQTHGPDSARGRGTYNLNFLLGEAEGRSRGVVMGSFPGFIRFSDDYVGKLKVIPCDRLVSFGASHTGYGQGSRTPSFCGLLNPFQAWITQPHIRFKTHWKFTEMGLSQRTAGHCPIGDPWTTTKYIFTTVAGEIVRIQSKKSGYINAEKWCFLDEICSCRTLRQACHRQTTAVGIGHCKFKNSLGNEGD